MKPAKVWAVLEFYDRELTRLGIVSAQMHSPEYASRVVGKVPMLGHCLWMVRRCLNVFRPRYEASVAVLAPHIRSFDGAEVFDRIARAGEPLEKAMRWLGYVQGVLNVYGVYSCDELRDHSRGGEGEFESATPRRATFGHPPPA
jgi:hypothetical protein